MFTLCLHFVYILFTLCLHFVYMLSTFCLHYDYIYIYTYIHIYIMFTLCLHIYIYFFSGEMRFSLDRPWILQNLFSLIANSSPIIRVFSRWLKKITADTSPTLSQPWMDWHLMDRFLKRETSDMIGHVDLWKDLCTWFFFIYFTLQFL